MKTTSVLLIIVIVIMGAWILNDSGYFNDGPDDADADDLPQSVAAIQYDSMIDTRVGYSTAGAVLTSHFYENGQYNIVAYHGSSKDTAVIVASDTITVVAAPSTVIQDYAVIAGGAYQPGNGALGFKVTNNNLDKTCFVWVWEA